MDRDALLLPFRDEGLDLCIQFLLCGEAAMQALLRQGRELDLDPLEPTTRLGREGKLEVLAECKGFRGRERFIERTELDFIHSKSKKGPQKALFLGWPHFFAGGSK